MSKKLLVCLCLALFISLSMNVFFLGVMVGSSVSSTQELSSSIDHDDLVSSAVIASTDDHLKTSLSDEDKKIIRQAMRKYKNELRYKKGEWMKSRRALKSLSSNGGFNRESYHTLSRDERHKFGEMRTMMGKVWEEVTPQLSPEGRAIVMSMHEDREKMKLLHDVRQKGRGDAGGDRRQQRREKFKRFKEQRELQRDQQNIDHDHF